MTSDAFNQFVIEGMTFSNSRLGTYLSCPYAFKKIYIDKIDIRASNFFAEFGLLIHECMERYFSGDLEAYELTSYYANMWFEMVLTPPPSYLKGISEKYRQQGFEFFDTFSYDLENWSVIGIEETVNFEFEGYKFTGRPDLVLESKATGENTLLDYKSSIVYKTLKSGKEKVDEKKLAGYHNQLYLYCYGIKKSIGMHIDKISIWYTRPSRIVTIDWDAKKEEEVMESVKRTLLKITADTSFEPDTTSSFYCNTLCNVRSICPFI